MTELLVHSTAARSDGTVLEVTPESAGWGYVGFEVLAFGDGAIARRPTGNRELCAVVISGTASVISEHGLWRDLASRITKLALQQTMGASNATRVSAFRVFRTHHSRRRRF